MLLECIYGPKDGEVVEILPDQEIYGVMIAHSPCYHPFFDGYEARSRPAFVVLYRLKEGRLEFLRYV